MAAIVRVLGRHPRYHGGFPLPLEPQATLIPSEPLADPPHILAGKSFFQVDSSSNQHHTWLDELFSPSQHPPPRQRIEQSVLRNCLWRRDCRRCSQRIWCRQSRWQERTLWLLREKAAMLSYRLD